MKHILKCHETADLGFVKGLNCYLYDMSGRQYVDFESGVWCSLVGHNHPRIQAALRDQLTRVTHLGYRYTSHLAEEAAISLLETLNMPRGKCVFLSSGSEAVELAVQIARAVTGRTSLLTLAESHLAAYGTAGGMSADDWIWVGLDGRVAPETTVCQDAQGIAFDQVAAFVLEPGSASGTIRFPSGWLVDRLAKGVRRNNGLVVVDEVTTGMGRTGQWYGFNHYQLQPDIVACGKGLGNGYPVSAVAMRHNIARKLEESGFHYIQSRQNDPLGCAVAKEVINVIRDEELIQRGSSAGAALLGHLHEMKDDYKAIKDVRGRGLMVSIELFGDANRSANSTHVYHGMLERGILVGHNPQRNIIRFLPPLTIEESEIAGLVTNLQQVLEDIT